MYFLMWSLGVGLAGGSALNVVCLLTVGSVHVLTRDKEVDIRCDVSTD